jgi:4'-phosphopantetheinyl transferase
MTAPLLRPPVALGWPGGLDRALIELGWPPAQAARALDPPPRAWRLHAGSPGLVAQVTQLLGPDERARAARLRFEADRRRYVGFHAALRTLLGEALEQPPEVLAWETGPHGKPRLPAPSPVAFNLSHSHDTGALLIGSSQLSWGIDLEELRPVDDIVEVARRVFTPPEFEAWQSWPPGAALTAFHTLWTRKEACLKAIGSGFAVEPGRFTAGLEPCGSVAPGGWRPVTLPTPEGRDTTVLLCDLDVGPGLVAAVAAWPGAMADFTS